MMDKKELNVMEKKELNVMEKKELEFMELDNVSGGSWLDDLIDFGQDAVKEIAPYIEEYQEYLPLPR